MIKQNAWLAATAPFLFCRIFFIFVIIYEKVTFCLVYFLLKESRKLEATLQNYATTLF